MIPSMQELQEEGGFRVVVRSTMPNWAVADAGAPAEVWLDMRSAPGSDELEYDVVWANKTATRLPEVCLCPGPDLASMCTRSCLGHKLS